MFSYAMRSLVFFDKSRRSFVLALRSLWLHKLRSFLSVLGIIIGTASVITLMGFGEGSMQDALEDIKRAGATNVIVESVKPPDDASARRTRTSLYGLTYADYKQFLILDGIKGSVPMRIFPQEVRYLHRSKQFRVVATTAAYQNVNKVELVSGRFLWDSEEGDDPGDGNEMKNVIVLGAEVAETLFPFQDAVGQCVDLNKSRYVVVGVVKPRTALSRAGAGSEQFNTDVYIPLSTCRGRFGERVTVRQSGSFSAEQVELHQVTLTVNDIDKVREVGKVISDQLENSHVKKDWRVIVPLDRLEEAERAKERYLILLFLIALISLGVGGIGIMNIMLATVTERTREIGIRRALGAKRWDITFQFLIEAMVQTIVGGAAGTFIGIGLVYTVPWAARTFFEYRLPAQLNVLSIILSMSVSAAVGVFFGLYPAYRASRLDPIEALRHD